MVEGKKKKKFKLGKTIKRIERAFIIKKHHKKNSSNTSSSAEVSLISPTATTFTESISINYYPTAVYLTFTDKNFNYFLGYPSAGADGSNFYRNQRLMVAQPTKKCGCCDNKLIIVTKAVDDNDQII